MVKEVEVFVESISTVTTSGSIDILRISKIPVQSFLCTNICPLVTVVTNESIVMTFEMIKHEEDKFGIKLIFILG